MSPVILPNTHVAVPVDAAGTGFGSDGRSWRLKRAPVTRPSVFMHEKVETVACQRFPGSERVWRWWPRRGGGKHEQA